MDLKLICFVYSLLMWAGLASSKSQNLATRNAFDLVHVLKGGILISNGKQTSCDLTVIDSKSSVVAASCLKYSTGTTIDSSANYQVYLSDGGDGGKAEFKVDKITVHPKYNPSTFANNIAVLQYNSNAKNSWQHLLATSASYEWDQLFFGRAVLADMEKLDWMLYYSTTSSNHDGICDKLSELFAENVDDMVCNGNTTGAAANYLSDCKIPYGTAFGIANNKAYVIGPYSHTAINNGINLCASSMQRSYYTSLGNFAAFLSQTLGRDVLISDEYFHTNVSALNPDYTMIDRDFSDDNGLKATIVSGDYFKDQKDSASSLPPNFESSTTDSATGGNFVTGGSGLSRRETVIVAVCVSVGGAVLIGLVLLLIVWWRWRSRDMADPMEQTLYREMIESDIGGATVPALLTNSRISHAHTVAESEVDAAQATRRASGIHDLQIPEVNHADLPPMYDEAVERRPVSLPMVVEENYKKVNNRR